MGTHIEAVATASSQWKSGLLARGARRLSDAAARACLARGGRRAGELDLVVNAGLYKEHGLAEPALASLIQEDIGANPGRALHHKDHGHGTFSFDVMNGGCGVLTALEIVDGFLTSGAARSALVVSADVDPDPETSRGYSFPPVGGAVLVRRSDDGAGFRRFLIRTFPEHADLFKARIEWDPMRERNVAIVEEELAFAHRCRLHAVDVTRELLARAEIDVRAVDLLVTSQYPARFGTDLARALELPPEISPPVSQPFVGAHTAGVIASLESAFTSGRFARARRILFVTVGAGITVGAALYERV